MAEIPGLNESGFRFQDLVVVEDHPDPVRAIFSRWMIAEAFIVTRFDVAVDLIIEREYHFDMFYRLPGAIDDTNFRD